MTLSPPIQHSLVSQIDQAYEALRADVLRRAEPVGGGLGRSVVLHRGVSAWAMAWRELRPMARPVDTTGARPPATSDTPASGSSRRPTVPRAEATHVLASMVLSNLRELQI